MVWEGSGWGVVCPTIDCTTTICCTLAVCDHGRKACSTKPVCIFHRMKSPLSQSWQTRRRNHLANYPPSYAITLQSADPLGVSEYIDLSYHADLAILPTLTANVTGWPSYHLSEVSCPAQAAVAMKIFLFYRGPLAEQKQSPEGGTGGRGGLYPPLPNSFPKLYTFCTSNHQKQLSISTSRRLQKCSPCGSYSTK